MTESLSSIKYFSKYYTNSNSILIKVDIMSEIDVFFHPNLKLSDAPIIAIDFG